MDEAALLLLGAVAGAVAAGVAQLFIDSRQRQLGRMVAARLVLGSLFVLEHAIDLIEEHQRWPDRPDLDAAVADWHQARERFAAAVTSGEWAVSMSFFENLRRTAAMVRPGQPCTQNDFEILSDLKQRLPRVTEIVSEHATPRRERAGLAQEVRGLTRTSKPPQS